MNVNLEYYKMFYYVAKAGSITQAAEQLSVSQPAVSQAVKNLEQNIGIPLFIRTGKGVRLTSAGEMLFSYVERGYESILLGEQKLQDLMSLETGEIRIGASDMTLRFYLLPFLQRFHEAYPKIRLNVTNGPTPETIHYLQQGKIDFGVVTDPLPETGGMEVYPVRKITDVFVAGLRFLEFKNRTVSLKELEQLPIISLEKNTSTRRYMDRFMEANGIHLNPEIELATSDMIVQFARRNLGVASVMEDFARDYLERGELFSLKLQKKIPSRQICVLLNRKHPLSAAAHRLTEMMELKNKHKN